MKALKKVITVILAAVMLCGAFSVTAFARCDEADTYSYSVDYDELKYALAEMIADNANATIDRLVAQAQANPYPNISALVFKTNLISANAIALIRMLGFDAECVYETYIIGGIEVEIDPIIIIKRDIDG